MSTITLYDIATRNNVNMSFNTMKTRLCLQIKNIPYKVEWVEYFDIGRFSIEKGIAATGKKRDGSPRYTLPAIYDPSTGTAIADSYRIALYLDKTYPDTPKLFPDGTHGLQRAFMDSYSPCFEEVEQFTLLDIFDTITERGAAFVFNNLSRSELEDMLPKGQDSSKKWDKYRDDLSKLDSWYATGDGPFLMGSAPVWADVLVAAELFPQRQLWGKDSDKWMQVASWHNGRWGRLVELLDVNN